MFICQHCGKLSSTNAYKRAGNSKAWALGKPAHNGFHVRRVVWGLLMAQTEKRFDEEIRAVVLVVEAHGKKRQLIEPEVGP